MAQEEQTAWNLPRIPLRLLFLHHSLWNHWSNLCPRDRGFYWSFTWPSPSLHPRHRPHRHPPQHQGRQGELGRDGESFE